MQERLSKGTYYEIGFNLGKLIRNEGYTPIKLPEERLQLADRCKQEVKRHTPDFIDELEGILDGGKYRDTDFWAFILSITQLAGCSIFAISGEQTKNGLPLYGRNCDWEKIYEDSSTLCYTHPEGRFESLSCTDLFIGRYGGINEAGVAVAYTLNLGYRIDKPGVMPHLLIRWVLDTCQSTKDACDFLMKVPHSRGINLLVADKNNDIAIIEALPEKKILTHSINGLGVITNHFFSPEIKVYEEKAYMARDTKSRFNFITNWFESQKGSITEKQVQDVLSGRFDIKSGVSVDFEHSYGLCVTLWSWTASIGEKRMDIAHKPYSGGEFKSFTF